MAEFPNTNPFNGYSHSWTQPYLPTSYNPFYQPSPQHRVEEELIRWDTVDACVLTMTEYPEALELINRAVQRG